MTRTRLGLLSIALLASTLAACDGSEETSAEGPDSTLLQALDAAPSTATHVSFGDTDRWRARHGVSSASPDGLTRALTKGRTASTQGRWWQGINVESSTGWGVQDTAWNATVTTPEGTYEMYRFRDSVDMAKVGPGLVKEGYTDKGKGVFTTSIAQTQDSSGLPRASYFLGTAVRVDTGRRLLLTRMAGEAPTLPAADATLASTSAASRLVNNVGDVDYADIALGDEACSAPERLTPAAAQALHLDRFKPIDAKVVAATDDTAGVVRTSYDSDATAAADLKPRRDALAGQSITTREPYAKLLSATVAQDGPRLGYTLKPRDQQTLSSMVQRRDEPWAVCPIG